jgi:hypothetical protein
MRRVILVLRGLGRFRIVIGCTDIRYGCAYPMTAHTRIAVPAVRADDCAYPTTARQRLRAPNDCANPTTTPMGQKYPQLSKEPKVEERFKGIRNTIFPVPNRP